MCVASFIWQDTLNPLFSRSFCENIIRISKRNLGANLTTTLVIFFPGFLHCSWNRYSFLVFSLASVSPMYNVVGWAQDFWKQHQESSRAKCSLVWSTKILVWRSFLLSLRLRECHIALRVSTIARLYTNQTRQFVPFMINWLFFFFAFLALDMSLNLSVLQQPFVKRRTWSQYY